MEREKELLKLINVLRRTGRMALQAEWTGGGKDPGTAAYCVGRYNRVLERLKEIDADVATVFDPLPPEASLSVVAMACRQLVAYFEDDLPHEARRHRGVPVSGFVFDGRAFKEFWRKSAHDIEDLGEFIRESIAEWMRQRKGCEPKGDTDASATEHTTGTHTEPPPSVP
jgi:hypothetical protein